jgi:hypothetical protein
MASKAEGEVILQLAVYRERRVENVFPACQNAQKSVGRVTKVDEAARFGGRKLQERRSAAYLGD